jgi:hypothetical protein
VYLPATMSYLSTASVDAVLHKRCFFETLSHSSRADPTRSPIGEWAAQEQGLEESVDNLSLNLIVYQ